MLVHEVIGTAHEADVDTATTSRRARRSMRAHEEPTRQKSDTSRLGRSARKDMLLLAADSDESAVNNGPADSTWLSV
jgi:hypothetical protein